MPSAAIVMALAAGPAAAQDATPAPPAASPATCTNAGNTYQAGDYACIAACHGERRLARCDVNGQSAAWTYVSNACPSAMINGPWPATWSALPPITDMTPIPIRVRMSAIDPAIAPLVGAHYRQSVLTR